MHYQSINNLLNKFFSEDTINRHINKDVKSICEKLLYPLKKKF